MRIVLGFYLALLVVVASPSKSSAQSDVTGPPHGTISANGIDIHFVEQGEGPLVLFLHGFPESWYSWRHQIPVVADAGYRAVALDMRGYGQTSKPEAIASYSISHLAGDVIGAVAAVNEFGIKRALAVHRPYVKLLAREILFSSKFS